MFRWCDSIRIRKEAAVFRYFHKSDVISAPRCVPSVAAVHPPIAILAEHEISWRGLFIQENLYSCLSFALFHFFLLGFLAFLRFAVFLEVPWPITSMILSMSSIRLLGLPRTSFIRSNSSTVLGSQ